MSRTEILLESGTNEIEIMKFTINDDLYGINVAKVREIMMACPANAVPHSHPSVEGIFKPRDTIFTVVDLPYYLTGQKSEQQSRDLFMITGFNKVNIAFRVQSVVGIQRMSWKEIKKPDVTLNQGQESIATGITECDGQLVIILDFEKIVADIAPDTSFQQNEFSSDKSQLRTAVKIFLAEDSTLLTKLIVGALAKANYTNVIQFNNGAELWDSLSALQDDPDIESKINIIITDIEMPQMDGHRLTKLIKSSPQFKHLPVIIFSSLINEEMMIKGKELGADVQLSKPDIGNLVSEIDRLLGFLG